MDIGMEVMITAFMAASMDQMAAALRVLRGETVPEPQPATGPLLLGMGQAARLLGVSRPTLWRLIQAGRLKKVELYRGSYRLKRSDVEALAESRSSGKDQ